MASSDPVERLALAAREGRFGEAGGVNPDIAVSTAFTVLDAKTMPAIFSGTLGPDQKKGGCYLYGRSYSPTVQQLARQLAAMEATESAYAVASGMAAISCALLALCNSGDHIVASNCVYGGTHALLKTFLPLKCNITVSFVDITDTDAVAAALTPRTKVVYCETVSNPTLVVADLPALAALAHGAGAALVVDNTFTPLAVTPAAWGADVVVHSLTKFVSGASDIIAGAVCGSAAFVASLMDLHAGPIMLAGPTMDPRIASVLLMRLPHLPLRMAEHCRRAAAMAVMLEGLGAEVSYPGLVGHRGHGVLSRLLNPGYGAAYGGLLGINMGAAHHAEALMERLQNKHGFGLMAVSLGYSDTLMSLSAASTSSELDAGERAAADIAAGYVRMSIGITGTLEQRLAQLREAYEFVAHTSLSGVPYTATKVRVAPDGSRVPLMSWPSWGPQDEEEGGDQEGGLDAAADAAIAAALAAGADATAAVTTLAPAAAREGGGFAAAAAKAAGGGGGGPADSGASAGGGSSLTTGAAGAGADEADGGSSRAAAALDRSSSPATTAGGGVPKLIGTSRHRLACAASVGPRPVKVRKLDDDTLLVFTPTLNSTAGA